MSWHYPRQSPLAHLHLAVRATTAEAPVWLCERPPASLAIVRGDADDAGFRAGVERAFGLALPLVAGTSTGQAERCLLWLGPDEWLIRGPDGADLTGRLGQELGDVLHQRVAISDARALIGLGGERAREVLSKGCGLDLHPSLFRPGACTQTLLGRVGVLLHALPADRPQFDLYVARSYADYLWHWLADAASEFGCAIREGG
ncbi:MAG: sarcosine oxidase subunit gamma [Alphaproteobacteria bacterium]|nr:sarcosine oxidase subunit gamma [Alphaproteobacteria bacterium]